MTDDKLADEIERMCARTSAGERIELSVGDCYQIIAALRRPDPVLGECEECGHTIVTPLKRLPEHQPSSDKVLVPRDVLIRIHNECKDVPMFQAAVWNLLAAAEAEEVKT